MTRFAWVLLAGLLAPVVATAQDEHAQQAEHGEHGEHAAAHEEHHHFDWREFSATVLNFTLWLALIYFLARKPLGAFLRSRRAKVVDGLEESRRLMQEAERKYAEYSDRLAHLNDELAKLRKEMLQAGEAERDRMIAEAETRAARMRRDARFIVEQQMKQLRTDLTREAIEAAVAAAEAVLREQIDAADQQRLAEVYLAELRSTLEEEARA